MDYNKLKSHKKPGFHALFRRYTFRKTTGGVDTPPLPSSRFRVKWKRTGRGKVKLPSSTQIKVKIDLFLCPLEPGNKMHFNSHSAYCWFLSIAQCKELASSRYHQLLMLRTHPWDPAIFKIFWRFGTFLTYMMTSSVGSQGRSIIFFLY